MSAVEWIPGNWNDVEIGQNVCLRNDDGAEVEISIVMRNDMDYPGTWLRSELCRYAPDEWHLFVNATPLPTDPGWYLDKNDVPVYLAADGYWTTSASYGVTGESMANHAPFRRMEPVAVTHARILPSLREAARCIARPEDSARSEVSTTDVLYARRILANLITELEATK